MKHFLIPLLILSSCGRPSDSYDCTPDDGTYCVCGVLTDHPKEADATVYSASENGCKYNITYSERDYNVCSDNERFYDVRNTDVYPAFFQFTSCSGQRGMVTLQSGGVARFYGAPHIMLMQGHVDVN